MSGRVSPEKDAAAGLWRALSSVPVHLRVVTGAVAGALNVWEIDDSLHGALRLDGWLLLFGAVTYLMRWVVHVSMQYVRFSSAPRRGLALVTIADGGVAVLLIVMAAEAVRTPGLAIIVGTIATAWVCAGATCSKTARLLRHPQLKGLGRGSERFQRYRLTRRAKAFLRPLKHVPPFSTLRVLLGWLTPRTEVSSYILGLFTGLLLIGCTAAASVEAHAAHHLARRSVSIQARGFNRQTLFPRRQLTLSKGAPVHTTSVDQAGRDYTQDCVGWPAPGAGAPAADRIQLASRFAGGGPVPGLGAPVAGCAFVTHPEYNEPTRWWVTGWCGPQLRSLAIAWPGASAIMLEQVAVYARYLAMRGLLLSATRRVLVGDGDLQLLQTTYGSVVFVRLDSSAGEVTGGHRLGACAAPTSRAVRYVVLPPSMIALWVSLMRQEHDEWLWPVYDRTRRGRAFSFVTADSGSNVANGSCTTNGNCAIVVDGRRESMSFQPHRFASLGQILHFAPRTDP
jgi:hypothetical protein